MFEWLISNIGSVIAVLALIVIVALIIIKMFNDKRRGKSNCGCNCGCCAMKDQCHK